MKKLLPNIIFFIGWLLSPFTWWNDVFVNVPFSYLLANLLFYIFHLPFRWLVIGSYWFSNFLGLFFMYLGGERIILSSRNKIRTLIFLIISLVIYSAIMIYLDEKGKLLPLGELFTG